ncbi:rhodanese-like domain-containing protein [Actinidia rufa]|uniref:Peptidyl-prolyl cis-trans isomerase n=1 Tax=Actinidia rufa TaxID=165716 RepID=A0A7J0F6P9_9ERIC|nr:rhodanese-like domain-containing protein [Actinidia rufa]
MLRACCHLPIVATTPALIPTLDLFLKTSSTLARLSSAFTPSLPKTLVPNSPPHIPYSSLKKHMGAHLSPKATGEELSILAEEYSICPSKEEGGMLGWVRKGQMVPEFEEAAFKAPVNKVVRCKTKFGWHLLEVLSERDESILQDIEPHELHGKMQEPCFIEQSQLIDVREPDEVYADQFISGAS